MRTRLISRCTLPFALLLATFTPASRAAVQVQNRISAPTVNGGSRVTLQGNVSGRVRRSTDLGPAAQDRKLSSLSLHFSLTPAQQADLNQLQAAQLNPGSPSYHQWLTPEQFGTRFGLSSSDIAKVASWLTSQGFTVTSTARSSTFITFSGTVAQVQQAFGASVHNLSYHGEQYVSNTAEPVLPSAIAAVVSGVTGLNSYKLKAHSRVHNAANDPSRPAYTQTIGGTTSHYMSPADLYTIYDFPSASATPLPGTGITIAIMGQSDIIPANVAAFRTAAGLPAINLTQMLDPNSEDPGVQSGDVDEAHLDIEWAGAAAPGAAIRYVYSAPDAGGAFEALTYAIDAKLAPIVSISYGGCETFFGNSLLAVLNLTLQQANVQGMTVISASGDTGAADCDAANLATEGLSVDFPGSSPYVTSAGGTMFSGDVSSPATYWNSSNGTSGGSALMYISEVPWNETTATAGLDAGGAGGGGASAFFAKPSWQTGIGVPSDGSRDVPDFSMNAAANHDGYMVCSSGSGSTDLPCTNGFLTSSGQPSVFGGTSFVAPIFAGILAQVEQKLATTTGVGNIGPTLYGLASVANVFHDITTGNNSVECAQGTPNCTNGGPIGFNAGVGYDLASGLGSFDVAKLINSWSTAVPTGGGGNPASTVISTTTTVATSSAAICGINSATFPLTVTVASGAIGSSTYIGQPVSTTTPTGMVQVLIDNVAVGSPQPLVNGVASITLSTATISSGGHTISASYSGDGTFAGSKGTLLGPAINTGAYPNGALASVDFVSTTSKDFSITPCSATTTVNSGATSSGITFTVTPFNGFTGTVNLTVTNNQGMAATPAFTVQPVNITGSTAVTTSFTVLASQPTTSGAVQFKLVPIAPRHSDSTPWYAAGSGTALACVLFFAFPRRRRWGALLAIILSVGAITTVVGCSNNTVTAGGGTGGGGGGGGGNPTTPATSGTYTFIITAVSGSLVHSTQVAITVP